MAEMLEQAEKTALKFLKEENWVPINLEETWEVTEKDYENDSKGLEIYQQVLIDKEVYNFHTYVLEAE